MEEAGLGLNLDECIVAWECGIDLRRTYWFRPSWVPT
jgi:hypothetical protein